MKKYKKPLIIILAVMVVLVCIIRFGYVLSCYWAIHKIEALNLPEDAVVYENTIGYASDIYWVHMRAEKVIVCEEGVEYVQDYVKENNNVLKLVGIDVGEYTGMTDMCHYDFEHLSDEEREAILEDGSDKYIRIVYECKFLWLPTSWYYYDPIEK